MLDFAGERLGQIADLAFVPSTGEILHYLVSRSDPRLPGTSRWRLTPDRIVDQQPGLVSTGLRDLDDLPEARASVRQDFVRRSRHWREQLQQFGDRAGERLEGWLEEPPWDEHLSRSDLNEPDGSPQAMDSDPLEDWTDDDWIDREPVMQNRRSVERDGDPWI